MPSWKLVSGTFLFFVLLGVGAVAYAYASTEIPNPSDFARAQTSTVYFSDGTTEIGSFSEQDRVLVESEAIPDHVKNAVVAAEDRSFYDNPGINPAGIVRALWNNVRGGDQQGGSSITQQYAERYYFGETVSSYTGKIREAFLAVKLDRAQDKDEILVNYLNTIYFGRDAYGIEVAAQSYFGVPVGELTVSQAALIAGIIPSPNNWDPAVAPEKAEQRWNYVLDGMVATGTLTQAERDAQVFPEAIERVATDTYAGPNGYLLREVRDEIVERTDVTEEDLDRRGYTIVTTIDPAWQQAAVAAVAELPEDAPENLRTGLVSIDPATGAIRALYGGPDYLTVSRNAVTQDTAQAGSTFKPFTLVAHLESGNSLRTTYNGNNDPGDIEGWDEPPGNFGGQSFGRIDVARATANSVNTVYAQMNAEVGPEATVDVAVRAGVPEDTTGLEAVPSNVLGSASPHPIDMARAYSTFAAQGVRTTPHIVQSVSYLDGDLVYEADTRGERVFEEDVMADTTYALTRVVQEGSGEKAQALGRPVAGKTGTSSDNKSAWFVGYTPQVVTAVALYQVGEGTEEEITPFGGYRQITGSSVPLDVWVDFMEPVTEGMEVVEFPARADVGKPPLVAVPDVVGLGRDEATSRLERAGFDVAVSEEADDDAPEGQVVGQNPTGEARQGATVTIVVSTGPAPVQIPDVVGLTEAQATERLQGAGFTVDVRREENEAEEGRVVSQNPTGEAEEGTTVTIVVSTGPPEEEEPPPPGDGEDEEPGPPDNPGPPDDENPPPNQDGLTLP
ncbi:PASTA domain-containing protein [Cellulomonas sp. APG4]|nr:PASTA domain-containing protein [Cellulomonas sp. APG4]